MGELLNIGDFRRTGVKRLRVHYDYVDDLNPTDLLADFINKLNAVPNGSCSADKSNGSCKFHYWSRRNERCTSAKFAYDGIYFDISEAHPKGGEIGDLFVEHLAEQQVPWELYEEVSVLDRRDA